MACGSIFVRITYDVKIILYSLATHFNFLYLQQIPKRTTICFLLFLTFFTFLQAVFVVS